MDFIYFLVLFLIIFVLILLVKKYRLLYKKEKHKKTSISVRHGKLLEHLVPWIKEIFPYDPQKFRFIGNPIDGIVFDDKKIVFVEIKTGKSSLNPSQKKIKSLVKEKKVEWKEIRTE